jgi:hypothetical protein
VERRFDTPVDSETQASNAGQIAPCLEQCGVRWVRSLLSSDGRLLICEYEAADAELVRTAHHAADLPFVRIWTALPVTPLSG